MKRRTIAALLVASLLTMPIAFLLDPSPQPALAPQLREIMPPQLNITYHSVTRNTTDVLRFSLESESPGAHARVLIEDPNDIPTKTLFAVNLTANEPRDVQLRTLPSLVRIRGVIEHPGTPVLTKWVWQGYAQVIIADSPSDLAHALAGGDAN